MRRKVVIALIAVLGLAGFLSFRQGPGTPMSAESLPARLSDEAFWHLVTDFSEPNGFFRSDNFLSNEAEYQWVIPTLTSTLGTGGVYLGVGPEQNFTYIVALRPKLAFIVDIRRGNLHVHLLYKAFIEMSADRAEFLSRLFARERPADLPPGADIEQLMAAYQHEAASAELFERNLQAARDWLVKHHSFALSDDDLERARVRLQGVLRRRAGSELFVSERRVLPRRELSYLCRFDDRNRRPGRASQLPRAGRSVPDSRELEKNNAIIPVVGNFAGPKALRAVGGYLRQHNATVSAFYTSNVEMYLFQQGDDWKKFYGNVATLPVTEKSTFIRSVSNRGVRFQFRNNAPGARASTRLNPIADLIRALSRGPNRRLLRRDRHVEVMAIRRHSPQSTQGAQSPVISANRRSPR